MTIRLGASGALTPRLTFASQALIHDDRATDSLGAHAYQPADGIPYNNQSSHRRTWDSFTGTTRYDAGWLRLQTGVDYLRQGPAERNPLLLSGDRSVERPWNAGSSRLPQSAPLLHLQFTADLGPLEYTQTSARLAYDKSLAKYMHIHRLAIPLSPRTTLGVGEAVSYGSTVAGTPLAVPGDSAERTLEWAYTLPFVPYFFAQHWLGDRENSMLFVDFTTRPLKRAWASLELYGELFLDDLKSPNALFDRTWWGNKWAFTGGLRDRHPLGSGSWDYTWEFTQIEPWVYTHTRGPSHDWTHYGQSLGSDLGPDSREHWLRLGIEMPTGLRCDGFISAVWKGTLRGSHQDDIHDNTLDRTDKSPLDDATRLSYRETGLALSFPMSERIRLRSGYGAYSGDYSGWRGWMVLAGDWGWNTL
jgi:hypothetical protein